MKIFKFMIVALVAMCGFASCSEDCDHNFIEYDYSKDLVGTWTCIDAEYAEALVIKADGSILSTGYNGEEYWEDVKGTIKTVNNKMTWIAEDGDNFEGRFDITPGVAFTIYSAEGESLTYSYCENNLADEIVGMWVCNDGPMPENNDMAIQNFSKDGKVVFTGITPNEEGFALKESGTFKIIGDLLIQKMASANIIECMRVVFTPKKTTAGDVLTLKGYLSDETNVIERTFSFLRVKESLNLANKSYDYNNLYLTNVKGKDQDINFWGYTMNLATMDGTGLDKMLKGILFHIEFPDANTISYTYTMGNNKETFSAPIVVEGNKLTVKMSEKVSTLKDIVYYAYQDATDSQMHLYMYRDAFVNFYTNMQAMLMAGADAQFDITDAEAIDVIYNNISDVVETINLSIVMK